MWLLIAIITGLVLVTRGGPRRRAVHEDRRGDRAARRGREVKAAAKHAHADLLRERWAKREADRDARQATRGEDRGARQASREERRAAGFVYLGNIGGRHFQDPELNNQAKNLLSTPTPEPFHYFIVRLNEVFHDGLDAFEPVQIFEPSPFGLVGPEDTQRLYDDLQRFQEALSQVVERQVRFQWPSRDLDLWGDEPSRDITYAVAF